MFFFPSSLLNCFDSLDVETGEVRPLLGHLSLVINPLQSDSLLLDVADLELKAFELSLINKGLERHIFLGQFNTDLASFVVERSFKLAVNTLRTDLTVILVEVVSMTRHRQFVVYSPL